MTALTDHQQQLLLSYQSNLRLEEQRIKVFIVDDHKVTLDGLVAGLSFQKDIVVVGFAANFQDGLASVHQLHPDIVVLDLHLPDAPSPTTMIRAFREAADARILIFSAEARMPFVRAALEVGARGYLVKSERVDKVAQAIRTIFTQDEIVLSDVLRVRKTNITKSEEEILKMLARGMKYDHISERRKSSPATVRKQCDLLLLKLALESREQLIAWAVRNGYQSLELSE